MENNIKILFWLHRNRMNKKGTAPLMLRVTYRKQRIQLATGFLINPDAWDQLKGKVKGRNEEAIQINQYVGATRARLIELYNDALKNGDIYLDSIISKFLGRDNNTITLMQLVQHHNDYFKARIGTDYSSSTFRTYLLTQKRLISFIKDRYGKKDVRLKDLKLEFIQEFDLYLKTRFSNEHNTVVKQCKNLKKMINMAIQNGWLDKSPFIGFKSNFKEVDPIYLSQKELDLIFHKDFVNMRLEKVRDLFIFQCYTGLAFADMAKLKVNDISIGIDGGKWIITRRKKTDKRSAIPFITSSTDYYRKI